MAYGIARTRRALDEGRARDFFARVPVHHFALLRLPVIYRRLSDAARAPLALPARAPSPRRRRVDAGCERRPLRGLSSSQPPGIQGVASAERAGGRWCSPASRSLAWASERCPSQAGERGVPPSTPSGHARSSPRGRPGRHPLRHRRLLRAGGRPKTSSARPFTRMTGSSSRPRADSGGTARTSGRPTAVPRLFARPARGASAGSGRAHRPLPAAPRRRGRARRGVQSGPWPTCRPRARLTHSGSATSTSWSSTARGRRPTSSACKTA